MVCYTCGHKTDVINSRHQKRINAVWRRRRCEHCTSVFTTQEQAELGSLLVVEDLHGRFHAFDRDKLFISIYNSLQHRPNAIADATALVKTILNILLKDYTGQVSLARISHYTTEILERFDHVAAVHYQAFHPAL